MVNQLKRRKGKQAQLITYPMMLDTQETTGYMYRLTDSLVGEVRRVHNVHSLIRKERDFRLFMCGSRSMSGSLLSNPRGGVVQRFPVTTVVTALVWQIVGVNRALGCVEYGAQKRHITFCNVSRVHEKGEKNCVLAAEQGGGRAGADAVELCRVG